MSVHHRSLPDLGGLAKHLNATIADDFKSVTKRDLCGG